MQLLNWIADNPILAVIMLVVAGAFMESFLSIIVRAFRRGGK